MVLTSLPIGIARVSAHPTKVESHQSCITTTPDTMIIAIGSCSTCEKLSYSRNFYGGSGSQKLSTTFTNRVLMDLVFSSLPSLIRQTQTSTLSCFVRLV